MSISRTTTGYSGIFLLLFMSVGAMAQNPSPSPTKCSGPIYTVDKVAQRAKIIEYADTSVLTKIAREYNFHGTIRAEAVLCRSGQVTDVRVTQQLPQNLSEFVAAAMGTMKFAPAELNFHTVSQRIQYELSINDDSKISQIDVTQAENRLVEELYVIGNRRMEKEEILKSIKTRTGEVLKPDQLQQDLSELMKTGYFNPLNTRVTVEDGLPRGGVRVIFEVNERPLIAQIAVERNYRVTVNPFVKDLVTKTERDAILNELTRRNVDVDIGRPLDARKLQQATEVIERYFRSQGWSNVQVEAVVENLITTEVKVTFKITGRNF